VTPCNRFNRREFPRTVLTQNPRLIAMMKTIAIAIFLVVFASRLFTQEPPSAASARGGCGPSEAYFDAVRRTASSTLSPRRMREKQSLVFEDIERGPTMRVWTRWRVDRGQQRQILFFLFHGSRRSSSVHELAIGHLQGNVQAHWFGHDSQDRGGKVYYLRTQVYERSERDQNVKLEPVEPPKASSSFRPSASVSIFHPKK